MTEGNCKLLSVTEQPPSESLQKGRGLMLPDDPIALQTKIYKSDEKCAAFLFPFKNYIFDPLVVKERIHIFARIIMYLKGSENIRKYKNKVLSKVH